MLKYSLRENLLTPAPDDYMAQAQDVRSYTLDEIIDLMMDKGTTITRADVAATLQVYGEVCASLIKDGSALNTPLFNTALTIAGVFNGANDAFDKKRHTVNLNMTAGTLLRDAVTKVKCEKTEAACTGPYITEVTDIVTGTVNTTLTKGGVVQLVGARNGKPRPCLRHRRKQTCPPYGHHSRRFGGRNVLHRGTNEDNRFIAKKQNP